jgi:hypothetical protein
MRRAMARTLTALLLASAMLTACRDEQAGPRPRALPGQPANRPLPQTSAPGRTLEGVPNDLSFRSGATWNGGTVVYLGAKVTPQSAKAGQTVTVTNYFAAARPPPQGWGFFVHIIDSSSGQMLMNADHEIQNGAMPLGSWPVGKIIEDTTSFAVPPSVGAPRMLLGFWQNNDRLPVDQPQAHDGTNRMIGPPIPLEQSLPEYHIHRTAKPPVIDGALNDDVWKSAEAVELKGSYDGRPVQRKTVARMLYDDANLYAAFDCEDPDVWGTLYNRDDAIYNQEVVEVFLDANADGKTYNELEVSPNNVIFDAQFETRRSDLEKAKAWDSGMKTAVKVRGTINNDSDRDDGWSVEMQIPINRLDEVPHIPPQPGDRWRFNLYRLEHLVREKQVEGQPFSPLYQGDFHNLPRFGWLVFD